MKVIGYTRVSTREQAENGHSLITQSEAIAAYCAMRGWDLVEIVEDAGFTGTRDDRPGFQRALEILRRKTANGVVVARMDRLFRSAKHLNTYMALARKQGWDFAAVDMSLDTTTANGRLVIRILGDVAEWESEMNSERVKDGMATASALLSAAGESVPWGFRRAAPAPVVERILAAHEAGESGNAIARTLTAEGIPSPGGGEIWYGSTVIRLVASEQKRSATTKSEVA
jgi:DNA invertase Pin-like site-specific DNA recombinase